MRNCVTSWVGYRLHLLAAGEHQYPEKIAPGKEKGKDDRCNHAGCDERYDHSEVGFYWCASINSGCVIQFFRHCISEALKHPGAERQCDRSKGKNQTNISVVQVYCRKHFEIRAN
jgi:hypothetical protein